MASRDSAALLAQVEQAVHEGVQPADLLSGAIDLYRDLMVLAAGAENVPLLASGPKHRDRVNTLAKRLTLDSILAALQILAEAEARIRGGTMVRLLIELAFVRIARLETWRISASWRPGSWRSKVPSRLAGIRPARARTAPAPARAPRPPLKFDPRSKPPTPVPGRERADIAPATAKIDPPIAHRTDQIAARTPDESLEAAQKAWSELSADWTSCSEPRPRRLLRCPSNPGALVVGYAPRLAELAAECSSKSNLSAIEKELAAALGRPIKVRLERLDASRRRQNQCNQGKHAGPPQGRSPREAGCRPVPGQAAFRGTRERSQRRTMKRTGD